ncbi:flagellar basal-body MS-ring/collar protein FliF [Terriglobus roseus]|nr:flagellar basal-body MS-ring/collar protein FliF [Terriglobus roseus]
MAESTSSGGSVRAILSNLRERWAAMPAAQRRLLLMCGAALLALSALSIWWGTRTDWRTLFSGMDGRDAVAMQQQLTVAGIPYQTTPDGTAVQVPAEQLDKARVAISTGGLPQSGRLGFELFDKPNWVGSEFDEKVNFQRALEGELEHTIGSLEAVRSARVHIVLPKQGAFSSEDQPAKASAVLKLRRSNLPREQSDAIRNLIAGSVEGLHSDGVTLVDADGRTDLSPTSASGNDLEQEHLLHAKLIQVLKPLAGAGNVHATVSIAYLRGSEEHTDEVYDPQSATPVSTQRTDQTSAASRPSGVAGASSNPPGAQATVNNAAPNTAPAATPTPAATQNGQTQTTHEESNSYAVTRHVTHTEEAPGRVRRVTAAIVVNDREIQQMSGKRMHTAWQHRTPEEMKQLQQLAQAAVGFDDKRGDQVVLENVAFSGNNDVAPAGGLTRAFDGVTDMLRAQPTLPRAVATGIGILILGLFVLRPLTKQTQQLLGTPAKPLLTAASTSPTGQPAELAIGDATGARMSTQHVFDRVTEGIHAEPESSRRLIGSWIGAAEEAD